MCNLYKEIAPEVTNGEVNFEICYFETILCYLFKHNSIDIKSKLVGLPFSWLILSPYFHLKILRSFYILSKYLQYDISNIVLDTFDTY